MSKSGALELELELEDALELELELEGKVDNVDAALRRLVEDDKDDDDTRG